MANNAETKIVEAIEWGDQAIQLKEFLGKLPVPNIVKVTKGQYRNIGFAKQVCSHLYLYSLSTGRKILAESVKLKEGKKAVSSEHKYAIPLTYQGWFEVLSEDGKAVKAIESVKELSNAFQFTKNASYLVRENVKGFLQNEGGDLSSDNAIVINGGDIISVVGEIRLAQKTSKGVIQRKFMTCMDKNGEKVFLDFEQKGLFSPVAGQQNISGVHTIHSILQKFRLPITVRLVHGIIPTKLEKHFTGVFRLLNIYSDETAFMYPFKKDSKMVPVSTREPLKLVTAINFEEIKAMPEFNEIHNRCDNMYNSFMNSIHLLFSVPEPDAMAKLGKVEPLQEAQVSVDEVEEDILFHEVEDIYQYVRDGGPTPPAPRPRPQKNRVPPLPDKKSNTKSKLAFLGKSFTNKFTSNNHSAPPSAKEEKTKQKNEGKEESPTLEKVSVVVPADTPQNPAEYKNLPGDDIDTEKDQAGNNKWDWMEPIYEPLDKIRKQKKMQSKKHEFKLDKSPELLSDPTENFTSAEAVAMVKTDVRHKVDPSVQIPPDPAVQNLRQVYKQHSVHDSGHTSSGSQGSLDKAKDSPTSRNKPTKVKQTAPVSEDIMEQGMRIPRPDYEDTQTMDIPQPDYEDSPDNQQPPPVPPKNFSDPDLPSDNSRHSHSSGSDPILPYPKISPTTHGKPHTKAKTSSITVMNNRLILPTSAAVATSESSNTKDHYRRSSQKHLPRGMSTTVHIEGPNTSPVVVGPSRHSVVSPTQGMAHPPYVAVARVGDGYDEKYSNGRQLQRTNSDHARRKLASMYL